MQGADRGKATVSDITTIATKIEEAGLDSLWMAHIRSLDAISALTVAGAKTSTIELGTAVTPIQPRHPMALAQQAMTAAQVCGGRFTLGIGLSHKVVIEGMLGLSYDQPARYMQDYLAAFLPLLKGKVTNYAGEHFKIKNLQIDVSGTDRLPVVLAALGPAMLKIAGTHTTGTSTWMVGPKTLETHVVKILQDAARSASQPSARVIAGFPVVVTNNVETAKRKLGEELAIYGELPSYRAMLDKEGIENPVDIALIGDENILRQRK